MCDCRWWRWCLQPQLVRVLLSQCRFAPGGSMPRGIFHKPMRRNRCRQKYKHVPLHTSHPARLETTYKHRDAELCVPIGGNAGTGVSIPSNLRLCTRRNCQGIRNVPRSTIGAPDRQPVTHCWSTPCTTTSPTHPHPHTRALTGVSDAEEPWLE